MAVLSMRGDDFRTPTSHVIPLRCYLIPVMLRSNCDLFPKAFVAETSMRRSICAVLIFIVIGVCFSAPSLLMPTT